MWMLQRNNIKWDIKQEISVFIISEIQIHGRGPYRAVNTRPVRKKLPPQISLPSPEELASGVYTEPNEFSLCKIWGFHGGDYEECGCGAI
jgi:hypothetical protein